MSETTPSENEWLIMEAIWSCDHPVTAAWIIEQLKGKTDVTAKTIRVMINRLLSKGIIGYHTDPDDARIYHYFALKGKSECLSEKKERFVKNYFGGNTSLAVASFLEASKLSEEQLEELELLVQSLKEK